MTANVDEKLCCALCYNHLSDEEEQKEYVVPCGVFEDGVVMMAISCKTCHAVANN